MTAWMGGHSKSLLLVATNMENKTAFYNKSPRSYIVVKLKEFSLSK